VKRQVGKHLHGQGMGRHSKAEIEMLGIRSIDAIAAHLGRRLFFMGDEPTGTDATIFAFTAGALCRAYETPIRTAAERHDNLKAYVGRMGARYFPEFGEIAGCKAPA